MEAIKKILRTPSAFVLFLVALVSLIGIVIQSEANKAIARMPIDATSTAEARLTEIAYASTMTQSAISLIATATPLSSYTETATATIFMDTPTSISSIPLLQDDFIDNRNGWLLLNEQNAKSTIFGGRYQYTINCPSEHTMFYCGYYVLVPNLVSKDFQFEIDATLKNIAPNNAEVMLAFQFRRNSGSYYDIYFRSRGQYTVNIVHGGSRNKLLDDTNIVEFDPNTNTTNRYGFYAVGSSLRPLFNGKELIVLEDGNINQAGSIYIAIFVSRGGSAVVELDNLTAMDKSK